MSEKEKLITAYHEGGHALVAAALPGTDPVHKITILPRGRALGYTMVLPDEDKYSQTRNEMLDQLAYMLGGRAAEEMVFHDPTTGAGNDIEKATARGPGDGHPVRHDRAARRDQARREQRRAVPRPRHRAHQRNYSEDVAAIDRRGGQEAPRRTPTRRRSTSSSENRDVLDALVLELLEQGDARQGSRSPTIFEPLRRRPARPAWTGSPDREPVDDPAGRRCPQAIRDRGRRQRPRAAPTARRDPDRRPGAGGDVHGDPGGPRPDARPSRPRRGLTPPSRRTAIGPVPTADATSRDVRPRPRGRGGRPRAADRDRRGPRPRGAARHAGPGRPGVRRAVRRACARRPRTC